MLRMLRSGEQEPLKAGVHGAIGMLVGLAALYNGVKAMSDDGEWDNLVNYGLYAVLAIVEARRAQRHWRQRT